MSLSAPAHVVTMVPVPLYRDTDDDLLQEPRSRVAFAPRPALRDPMTSPAFLETFHGAPANSRGQLLATVTDILTRKAAA